MGEARPGDMLLLPVASLQAEIVAQAKQNGASAILIVGAVPTGELDFPDGLAVIAIPSRVDIRTIQRALLTELINKKAGLIEKGALIYDQLSQIAIEGRGLEGLATAMAEISGRGVLIQDKRLSILAEYPSSSLHEIWGDILSQLKSIEYLPEPVRNRREAGKQLIVIRQALPAGLERFVAPIRAGEVARGYLSLVSTEAELDKLDQLVTEQGAIVCAYEMSRAKAIREAEKRLTGDLLTAILQENVSARDAMLWAQTMNLDLSQAYVALRFAWDGPSPPSRRRLETMVNGQVSQRGLRVVVNPMGSEVICFCQVASADVRPDVALEFGQAVVNQEDGEYPGAWVLCGVGVACTELSEWRTSFRQAGQALEMARRLGERKPFYFPDLSVYRLLLQIEHNPELVAFQEETLGALLAYEGGGELIQTLEAFFNHHGNLSQAADTLFVHRNTLVYRMERIAEITGLDLDHPDTRLAVQLALRISRMMGATRNKI